MSESIDVLKNNSYNSNTTLESNKNVKYILKFKKSPLNAESVTKENSINYDFDCTDTNLELLNFQKLKDFLAEIKTEKENSNKIIKTNPFASKELYTATLNKIEVRMQSVNDLENQNIIEIFNQRKLIMSNLSAANKALSLYDESIDLDSKIIVLDPNFDKSYSRLIECYLYKDNLHMANYYGNHVKKHFNKETIEKLKNALDMLEEANNKMVNDMAGSSVEKDKNNYLVKKSENGRISNKKSLFKFFFAGFVMLSSAISVFMVIKYRHKFTSK